MLTMQSWSHEQIQGGQKWPFYSKHLEYEVTREQREFQYGGQKHRDTVTQQTLVSFFISAQLNSHA